MTEDQQIEIDDKRDRQIERPIRLGQGKSRIDQLNYKQGGAS